MDNYLKTIKDNVNDFVNWLESSNNSINNSEILNIKIEDWSNIFSKGSKVIGTLAHIYNTTERIFFITFLKGVASQINNNNPLSSNTKQKLDDYLSKGKNLEFVYTTIRKSLTATSLKCTELLAIIVGEILKKQLTITPENITIIDALHTMNDYDLENFYKIYTAMSENGLKEIRLDKLYKLLPKSSFQISIRKLANLQIILQDPITIHQGLRFGGDEEDPLNTVMNDDEKFIIIYEISDKLFNLLEKTKSNILCLN